MARRQWDAVSRFQSQIIQKTHESLKFLHQPDQTIANSAAAIILLENMSVQQATRTFFDTRRQALDDLLATYDLQTTDYPEFLVEVARLIQMTVRQAWGVFGSAGGAQSLLMETLSKLDGHETSRISPGKSTIPASADDGQSTWLSGLFSERTNIHIMVRHLPAGLREETVRIDMSDVASAEEAISEALLWVKDITEAATAGVTGVLGNVVSGQHLWSIREKVAAEVAKDESGSSKPSAIRGRQGSLTVTEDAGAQTMMAQLPWSEASFGMTNTVIKCGLTRQFPYSQVCRLLLGQKFLHVHQISLR